MVSAVGGLAVSLMSAIAWAAFYFLRLCERFLPTRVLSLLLWPPAVAWDLAHLGQRSPLTRWRSFPESWRPKRWRFFLRQSLGLFHAQFLYLWPDRLCTARWLSRCRVEGGSNLIGSQDEKRGVVLASLHFGPFEVLPYWLRAHGIVTTSVRTPGPDSLKNLINYQYSLSPPADVPVFLLTSEMIPMPRFAHFRRFLGPGRRLLVMVDVDRGRQEMVPFENRLFRMATGAIQLAVMANAELIPCLIAETGTWRFAIHFGTPVPRNYLGNAPNIQAIGVHLLTEFSKVITRYPEQCKQRLLRAMLPLPVNGNRPGGGE
jgi:lauroyl/myristoyl acyltransferase